MKYSLVIPCYNEAANLPLLFERCSKLVSASNHDVEVVIVDNGSNDNSNEVLQELLQKSTGIRLVSVVENKGYGFGILSGLKSCETEMLAWTHADLQTDPMDLLDGIKILNQCSQENVFLKGKRYGRALSDTVFTLGMSVFETLLMRRLLWDINAQPTIFTKSFFDQWSNPPNDFSLDLYAYYMAKKTGHEVKRFPVRFGERAHGESHWNVDWSSKKKFIKRTIDYSLELKKQL